MAEKHVPQDLHLYVFVYMFVSVSVCLRLTSSGSEKSGSGPIKSPASEHPSSSTAQPTNTTNG